ncbi:MAG: radical SAM protein [Planctomycetota bacterium]
MTESTLPVDAPHRLLHSRYTRLARNTIDYWMLPDAAHLTEPEVLAAFDSAPWLEDASLQLYLHVPFCAQRCRFCAFSGGNSLEFREAQRYVRLVIEQMRDLWSRSSARGQRIRSVNIGGGSPDLLGREIGPLLRAVRDLPGCDDDTEIAVEFTLSTTKREFIDELAKYEVTKASFGIQSIDARVRRWMRQPATVVGLDRVLDWIDGRIPVVNADLITGLPGQDLRTAQQDLRALTEDPRIHAVSSYVLTAGAAPAMLAAMQSGTVPPQPSPATQALMRVHTYTALLREGWLRRGTNTYVDPRRVAPEVLERLAGNECIGSSHFEAFLLAAGPQAVSSVPGARLENHVDVATWTAAVERGEHPFHLAKCSTQSQRDTALWVFPLRWEGLPRERFEAMLQGGALTQGQLRSLHRLVREGLVIENNRGYELSCVGEVFMGHLVRELKSAAARRAVDDYIEEGEALGRAIADGDVQDENPANNRQIADALLKREARFD